MCLNIKPITVVMVVVVEVIEEVEVQCNTSSNGKCQVFHCSHNFKQTNFKDFSRSFQGKITVLKTKIYLINQHSLTPFDHPIC